MAAKIKVLYVDDEEANLNVFRIAFKRKYDITTAASAEEGLAILEKNSDFKVIIADHRMPGMSGIEMLTQVSEKFPKMTRIVISEYVNDEIIRNAIKSLNLDGSVGKPWDGEKLIELIEK